MVTKLCFTGTEDKDGEVASPDVTFLLLRVIPVMLASKSVFCLENLAIGKLQKEIAACS